MTTDTRFIKQALQLAVLFGVLACGDEGEHLSGCQAVPEYDVTDAGGLSEEELIEAANDGKCFTAPGHAKPLKK